MTNTQIGLAALAVARAVEIDHVQPRGAGLGKDTRLLERIGFIDLRPSEIALGQADALPGF